MHGNLVWKGAQSHFGHDEPPIWELISSHLVQPPSLDSVLWGRGDHVPLFEESPFTTSERSANLVGWGQHLGDC